MGEEHVFVVPGAQESCDSSGRHSGEDLLRKEIVSQLWEKYDTRQEGHFDFLLTYNMYMKAKKKEGGKGRCVCVCV